MRRYLPHTLFGRLVLAQLLLFGAIAVLLPTILLINLHRTADGMITQRLRTDARRIATALAGSPSPQRLDQALGPFYHRGWATRAYWVTDGDGAILYKGGGRRGLDDTEPPRLGTGLIHRGNLDFIEERLTVGGKPYRIVVAQDRTHPEVIVDDIVASFLRRTIWIVPLVFLGSSLISLLFFRRLTATMRHVAKDAERIGPASLDRRLAADRLPMEARSLAEATNRALDRVEQGYRRQTNFVSSVAHELRTPLALVTLRCDAMPDGVDKEALRRAVDQATHVVSQLMELAVIEGRPSAMGPLDLRVIARETVEASAPLVYRSGRTIEAICDMPTALHVRGNENLLGIAVTNLIDNAVRHTPPGTHIVVAAMQDVLFVCDNGPGLTRDGDEEGGTRYRSASLRRSDSAGLGLAIVKRIMAAMNGSMRVFPDTPGTHIGLRLGPGEPAAEPSALPSSEKLPA